jgi:hypothetical protein
MRLPSLKVLIKFIRVLNLQLQLVGRIIALSSPNGIGNWFHRMYTEAQFNKNDFKPIELKWDLHPDRDDTWYQTERANMSLENLLKNMIAISWDLVIQLLNLIY